MCLLGFGVGMGQMRGSLDLRLPLHDGSQFDSGCDVVDVALDVFRDMIPFYGTLVRVCTGKGLET